MSETIARAIARAHDGIRDAHTVRILYSAEAGSRAWGFASAESDYDVRFVYCHDAREYLRVVPIRDVIEWDTDDETALTLDINGWDIRKALWLFSKSNCLILEWLHSPTMYTQHAWFPLALRELQAQFFNPRAAIFHYLNMARNNFNQYLQRDEVSLKKYLYVIRPLLACIWIEQHETFPPVQFDEVFYNAKESGMVVGSEGKQIAQLVQAKKRGAELGVGPRNRTIHGWLDAQIRHFEEVARGVPVQPRGAQMAALDAVFYRAVMGG